MASSDRSRSGWLRQLGPFGTFVATAVAVITTNWVLVVSALLGLGAALWASAVSFFQSPAVETGVGVFLAILWTIIGITILVDRRNPRVVRSWPDYRYGLTFEGVAPAIDIFDEEKWFSLVLQVRNFSQSPIRYRIESFDFRVGSRALPKAEKQLTGYLARGSGKTVAPSSFNKNDMREFFGKRVTGTAEISISYGHPEREPERILHIGGKITLQIQERTDLPPGPIPTPPIVAFGADIVKEDDEPFAKD